MRSTNSINIMRSLRVLHSSMRKHLDRSPIKQKIDSVTGTHGWIIGFLADHEDTDVYQRDLEREFNISRSMTSKTLAIMEKNGLVGREKVARDDRLKKIVLTDKAKTLVEKIKMDNQMTEHKLTKGFSQEELILLSDFLSRMKENINE